MTFGIHDLAFKAPALYLPIEDLAKERGIEADKLKFGLGLTNMSVCDANEDVVSLAAGAVIQLIKQNPELKPTDIGRIYVGTESGIDGAKPIATYVHHLLVEYFLLHGYSGDALNQCDVVDMTFACIGAVDAMHNSLAWLRTEPEKVAIVIAADIANYDLASSGEYTQGAGAVAALLKKDPVLLAIGDKWGVATKSEHDFFKPIRLKAENNEVIALHDDKPIFDGQFSNETYQNRITEAWNHFKADNHFSDYNQFVFHLPYAFHGRRIITPLLIQDLKETNSLSIFVAEELVEESPDFVKLFAKTDAYKNWVKQHIAAGEKLSSEMGNLYTASIFLSLMSSLLNADVNVNEKLLFFAYGSGSKAKVFEATLQENYQSKVSGWNVTKQLSKRQKIDFNTYLNLRQNKLDRPILAKAEIEQTASGITDTNKFERTYSLNL